MIFWIREHPGLMSALGIASILMVALGLVLAPVLVARLPADYFIREGTRASERRDRHPVVHLLLRVLKNLLGGVLVVAGIAMLVLPGQGILTILVGLFLIDGPGKRRLELWLMRRPPVRRTIAWLRRRAGQPPLLLPDEHTAQR